MLDVRPLAEDARAVPLARFVRHATLRRIEPVHGRDRCHDVAAVWRARIFGNLIFRRTPVHLGFLFRGAIEVPCVAAQLDLLVDHEFEVAMLFACHDVVRGLHLRHRAIEELRPSGLLFGWCERVEWRGLRERDRAREHGARGVEVTG